LPEPLGHTKPSVPLTELIDAKQHLDTFPDLLIVTGRRRDMYQPESKAAKESEKWLEGMPDPANALHRKPEGRTPQRTFSLYGWFASFRRRA
jgi:hypothetical protein